MNVNYISLTLMLVCSILAVNIYITRKNNTDTADRLAQADAESVELNEKRVRCENDLKSREEALSELRQALELRKKENEEVQKNLDDCNKELELKKAEKEKQESEAAKAAETEDKVNGDENKNEQ